MTSLIVSDNKPTDSLTPSAYKGKQAIVDNNKFDPEEISDLDINQVSSPSQHPSISSSSHAFGNSDKSFRKPLTRRQNNDFNKSSTNDILVPNRGRRHSTFHHLPRDQKLDVRATQRTFEGAYIRTALGQLSFALVILKIFSREFVPIGTVFTVQGFVILLLALYRRQYTTRKIIDPYVKVYRNLAKEVQAVTNLNATRNIKAGYKPLNEDQNADESLSEDEDEDENYNAEENTNNFSDEQEEPIQESSSENAETFPEIQYQTTYFDTSGPTIVFVSVWSIVTYIVLLVLLHRLD